MAREFKRTDRVSEQLRRELAQIIQREIKDPRLGMVTVSAVDITRDLYHATAYVTFLGLDDEKALNDALDILNQAAGYIRSLLGKRIKMRLVPNLKFVYDASIVRGSEMTALIKQARDKDSSSSAE
ncbi:MAG: 30S ribosome-binding factor RbfA [Gammaproteobacteria bacterium]|nr:30S ribosome-binding factor RbfA [Gammaproteobacteria bacterium]MDH5629343.1 30S ribosome-binding factor RbfA [Gammaproteobacteria bacterium]